MRTLVLGLVLLAGCHHKLKAHADEIGAVRPEVVLYGPPEVELGKTDGSTLIGAVVNTVQEGRAIAPARRIREVVDRERVKSEMIAGVTETLGDGPPFAVTDAKGSALLQLEVLYWGLYVPYIGAQGEFLFDMRVKIYDPNLGKLYKSRFQCSSLAGDPPVAARIFSTVDNVRELELLSDAQIEDAFDAVSRWCGDLVVVRLRKHAG